jgi:hypothetical protein
LAACILTGSMQILGQEPPPFPTPAPSQSPEAIQLYIQTLRGRLAVVGHELQIAEEALDEASSQAGATPESLAELTAGRNDIVTSRSRLEFSIQSLVQILDDIESRVPDPSAPAAPASVNLLECTEDLRGAGLTTTSDFIVALSAQGQAEVILPLIGGVAASQPATGAVKDAITDFIESRRSSPLRNVEQGVKVVRIVIDCDN